jgi:hypothetical protein
MRTTGIDIDTEHGLQVEVYNNFEQLQTMKSEWDTFVQTVGAEIFLTYDWCRLWWKYYGKGRDLRVYVLRRNGDLVAIFPLFLEKIWLGPVYAKALKIVGSDFTISQFSMPVKNTCLKEIVRRFFVSVVEDDWDIIHLGPIAGFYSHYGELKDTFKEAFGSSCIVVTENNDVQTYFRLANTWDEYLASLNRKQRTAIRRHYRLTEKAASDETASITAECADIGNLEEMFAGFVQMHQKHWQRLNRPGHFKDWPSACEFHSELAKVHSEQKRLRLIKINLGKCCLGYKYGYVLGDNYFDFLDARSDSKELVGIGLGRILYGEMIKTAVQEKAKSIDSMQGRYKHKLEMGGELCATQNLYVIPRKSVTVIRIKVFRLFAYLLNLFYYRIWFNKVAPRLPLKRRSLWKIWIRTSQLAYSWNDAYCKTCGDDDLS